MAIVVLAPGADAETARARLDAHCRRRPAAFKAPRDYLFVDSLPRNAMGKVLKAELRRQAGASP